MQAARHHLQSKTPSRIASGSNSARFSPWSTALPTELKNPVENNRLPGHFLFKGLEQNKLTKHHGK